MSDGVEWGEGTTKSDMIFSVGGRMSKAPYKPIASACQKRHINPDPHVIRANVGNTMGELEDIRDTAQALGIDTSDFERKMAALDRASAEKIQESIDRAYDEHYERNMVDFQCPYEESGNGMDCYRCPVMGDVMLALEETL